ncbi:TPA: hypothetical protein PP865_002484 [Staphylococcus aureus]|nr:hypothetical protein [Staphylococcus aureus]HDJ3113199.1 hypothetical protein [Staphylococcus aureus]
MKKFLVKKEVFIIKLMRGIPFILIGLSIFIIYFTHRYNSIFTKIGYVIFVVGIALIVMQTIRQVRYNIIREINDMLFTLGYTENEIDERQTELNNRNISELMSIQRMTVKKIEEQKKRKFFEPIERMDK